MTTVAYVDAPAGVAGDMLLGALVDAGLDVAVLRGVVEGLGLEGVEVRAGRVRRGALAATKVDVLVDGAPAEAAPPAAPDAGRGLRDVLAVLRGARGLEPAALEEASRVFEALAEAEGRVHGRPPEEVHFHEVGARDALVDVVGTCVGLRRLGVTEVRAGPLPWGGGRVETEHGPLPLPAPAVAHLLVGHPVVPSDERHEQVTPTGAALVRVLATAHALPAGFVSRRVGLGAGTREGGRLPNVLRLVLGEVAAEAAPAEAVLLEANLDDATGQEAARALERALEAGALDGWIAPVTMKKGRPGVVVSLLVAPGDVGPLEEVLFAETPTLGVRRHPVARTVLARRHVTVRTPFGEVRMKVRETPAGARATPEHDDCLQAARRHGVALREVLQAAARAYGEGEAPASA